MAPSPASSLSIAGERGCLSFASIASPRGILSPFHQQSHGVASPTGSAGGRRSSLSGHYVPVSQSDEHHHDHHGEEDEATSNLNYTVHIPPTPDNRPMPSVAQLQQRGHGDGSKPSAVPTAVSRQQEFVSNTIFTGGFQSMTRGHVMDKMTESGSSAQPPMACSKCPTVCEIQGCDGKVMCDETGEAMAPCECGYAICRDCYMEALGSGGKCNGCKHFYKSADPDRQDLRSRRRDEDEEDDEEEDDDGDSFTVPPMSKEQAFERRLSLLKSFKASNPPLLMGKHTSEFDHARWLFESKGTYGYGNAVWPKDSATQTPDFGKAHRRQPLSRKKGISAGIISPYR